MKKKKPATDKKGESLASSSKATDLEADLNRPFTEEDEKQLQKDLRILKRKNEDLRRDLLETATTLHDIRSKFLYRKTHNNFKVFCDEIVEMSGDWANQLVDAFESHQIVQRLGYVVSPITALIPLRGLDEKQKEKAIKRAKKAAGNKPIKRKLIAAGADSVKAPAPNKRLAEIDLKIAEIPRGGLANEARRAKLEEEAAAIRAALGMETTVDTGSPPPPIDTEAEEPWTVERIHETIDDWALEKDPMKEREKFQRFVVEVKGLFVCP